MTSFTTIRFHSTNLSVAICFFHNAIWLLLNKISQLITEIFQYFECNFHLLLYFLFSFSIHWLLWSHILLYKFNNVWWHHMQFYLKYAILFVNPFFHPVISLCITSSHSIAQCWATRDKVNSALILCIFYRYFHSFNLLWTMKYAKIGPFIYYGNKIRKTRLRA